MAMHAAAPPLLQAKMPANKRRLSYDASPIEAAHQQRCDSDFDHDPTPAKRQRLSSPTSPSTLSTPPPPPPTRDIISTLSDELLVRILSYMDERTLLDISPVSKRFCAISADSQLWRLHYYRRFILPRAHRIPGFKAGLAGNSSKLQYSSQKSIWADGGWGRRRPPANPTDPTDTSANLIDAVDWKKQYKLRHNWAKGRCAVDEVQVSDSDRTSRSERQTLVKVVDGLVVTADLHSGLRAWDLRTRRPIAQKDIQTDSGIYLEPTSLALDGQTLAAGKLDIALGFEDGTFGVWRLDLARRRLAVLYRQNKSFLGRLVSVAYSYPYVLTAAQLGFITLHTFEHPVKEGPLATADDNELSPLDGSEDDEEEEEEVEASLPNPHLLTSLKSHYSRAPLALSIRKIAASTVASIAYAFDTVGGWSIGIQDFDIRPSAGNSKADVVTSRVAYTLPTETRSSAFSSPTSSPQRSRSPVCPQESDDDGPVKLCYSHPYLLATLPDNTLVLHLCTSTATSLTISKGIRLWGHTSGISDADITPRGKAVSVSARGDEIRVWELEGRVGGTSVELRPRQQSSDLNDGTGRDGQSGGSSPLSSDPEDRKNWVGFDDEMVIVLKGARDGRESLMVYDFT